MPNFDPNKLADFLNKNPDIQASFARSISTPEPTQDLPEKTPSEKEPVFASGNLITLHENGKTTEWRIVKTKDGMVTLSTHDKSGYKKREISEEDLEKIGKTKGPDEKPNVEPLGKLFKGFKEGTAFDLHHLLAWKKEWFDSGKLDAYRNQHGNITISDEQIADTKRAMELYVQALQTEGLERDIYEYAARQVGLSAKVLAGVDHPPVNNLKPLVEHYSSLQTNLDAFKERIEKKKPAPSPASAAPATEPTKEPSLPPDVRGTWPRNIVHDGKRGWTYTHNGTTETLPTAEWNAAEANIKPVFDDYFKFITEGNSSEQRKKVEFFSDIIVLKNEIVEFLNAKDPDSARAYAESFKRAFEEQRQAWEALKKGEQHASGVESIDKKYKAERDMLSERVAALTKVVNEEDMKPFLKKMEDLDDAYLQLRERVQRHTEGVDPAHKKEAETAFTEELRSLNQALTEKENEKKEELRQARKETRKEGILRAEDAKNRESRRRAFNAVNRLIRPVSDVQIDDTNKNQTITRAGVKGTIPLEDYLERHKAKQEAKKYQAEISQENAHWEAVALFEKMFKRDRNAFIQLYTNVTMNKATGSLIYTENESLRKHPSKEVIISVLAHQGIAVVRKTEDMIRADADVQKRKERGSLDDYKMVYRPDAKNKTRDKDKRTDEEKLAPHTTSSTVAELRTSDQGSGMVYAKDIQQEVLAQEGAHSLKERFRDAQEGVYDGMDEKDYEHLERVHFADRALESDILGGSFSALRAKLASYASNDTNPELISLHKLEKEIERLLPLAQEAQRKDASYLLGSPFKKLKHVVAEYIEKGEAFVAEKEKDPVIERRKKESLKKIDALTNKRTGNAVRKAELVWGDAWEKGNGRLRKVILASIIGAIGTYVALNDPLPTHEPTPQQIAKSADKEKSWREFISHDEGGKIKAKDVYADIKSGMSFRDLVAKWVPSLIIKDKPSSIDNILTMDARLVLNKAGVYNMDEEQQEELSGLLRAVQNIREAIDAPARTRAIALGVPYANPKGYEPGHEKAGKWLEERIQEIEKADK